jgi:DNA-binding PadR family transcriptional regulator
MSLEQKAQTLEASASVPCGVRDIVQKLRCKTSSVVSLLKEMEQERLIELRRGIHIKRGRPKKIITCTALGFEFLEGYRKIRTKPLRARGEDLERAVKDALYAERLVAKGHEAFRLFMELNAIAGNIKVSSEALANTGRE